MDDYTYQTHEVEDGTHILVFKNGEFERKVFVPAEEYNPYHLIHVLGDGFRELYIGGRAGAVDWLKHHRSVAKVVAVGKDFQLLSVEEFIALHG